MAVSSLGAGSGVLTSDVIEKLKAADTATLITPIDNKITLQKQKGEALNLLSSLLTSFKSNVSSLDDDTLYQQRSVSGNNSSVNVTANAGVAVQSFSITDTVLAQKNVKESGTFLSTATKVASGSGTMKITVGGISYNIDYTASTSLNDLKESINTIAGGKVKASTLQVGTDDYRLILTSVDTGSAETITISDSAAGTLNNTLLSYKRIESQAFTTPIDTVASGAGSLTIQMGNTSYNVNYDQTTSLENLRDLINTSVGSSVASIDGNNRLVLRSNVAGNTANLTLTDTGGLLDSKLTSYTSHNVIEEIQAASDASFKYNGVNITRSSNEISDIITGVTINLLANSGSASISIAQDVQAISDTMNSFVQNYNTLTSQLNSMTTSDLEAGKVGIFNGDSSINSITREINRIVTSVNENGYSLPQFGIDISQTGTMSFNETTFKSKFNADTSESEAFFSGLTSVSSIGVETVKDGVFTTLNTLIDRYTNSSNGLMDTLTTGSTTALKALNSSKTRSQALIEARYEAMMARFVQYDTIMTKLTNQFSSLKTQISMAINGTDN